VLGQETSTKALFVYIKQGKQQTANSKQQTEGGVRAPSATIKTETGAPGLCEQYCTRPSVNTWF